MEGDFVRLRFHKAEVYMTGYDALVCQQSSC